MKFHFIQAHSGEYPIALMCRALEVSESGYHAWSKREVSKRAQEDQELAEQIEHIFQANRGVYGSPRIHAELQEQGKRYGRKRIARLMQERGISAQRKRRRVRTTDSHHSNPVAPNLLNRQFSASAPNTKWVTDITAIETAEGDLYLAGVVDIYSRMAVGWAMGNWRGRAIGHQCSHDGCEQTTTTSRFAASLRSWQPIHESRISGSFEQLWCGSQHEQKSRLLR